MKWDVIVCEEDELFSLEIAIPGEYLGAFVVEFSEKFAINTTDGPMAKKVDNCFPSPTGCHVRVSVDLYLKTRLYQFIRDFCKERNLSFRDTENS